MPEQFRRALLWHMDRHETNIADLSEATGVSRDVIKKVRSREGATTTAENAMLIASFYGKTLNDFVAMRESDEVSQTLALLELLDPEEQRIFRAQIRGVLASRGPKSDPAS